MTFQNFAPKMSYFLGIDIGVRMASRKTSLKEKSIRFGIPSSRSLLKAIKGFLKGTDKARVILNISRRLFHVNGSTELSMHQMEVLKDLRQG